MIRTTFRLRLHFVSLILMAALSHAQTDPSAANPSVEITDLSVNHLESPLGLGDDPLSFSWKIKSDARGLRQTAYRLRVWPSKEMDQERPAWDSGVVQSDDSTHIRYDGPKPDSRERYQWQVELWTNQTEDQSIVSAPSRFEMALLRPEDWTARWIGALGDEATLDPRPAPLFRKAFEVAEGLASARAYVTGLGYFNMTLNSEPVSDHVLDPVVTQYDDRAKYLVFDLTERLATGENVVGITLGNGWLNQHVPSAWDFDKAPWRANPRLIAQIELEYEDGRRTVIESDDTWQWAFGPVVSNSIRNGVVHDAREEIDGWDRPGFDASNWQPAVPVDAPTENLEPQLMPPARVVKELDTDWEKELSDTLTVYGFPANTTGRAVVEVTGPPGESITLRYGERLAEDGRIDQKELSRFIGTGPTQTDRYIIGPSGKGRFEPSFMYHGFQYIQAEKSAPEVQINRMSAHVIHTDFEVAGGFECSHDLLNKLYDVTLNSFLTNYHSYPTDCPHREKIGWTGDGQLVMDFGLFNFDAFLAYRKWTQDMTDAQRPNGQVPGIVPTSGWGFVRGGQSPDPHNYRLGGYGPQWEGVCISLPWTLYLSSGDISILEEQYATMKGYYDFLGAWSEDGILRIGIDDHKWIRLQTEAPVIASAFYCDFARIMQNTARALGRDEEAAQYGQDFESLKAAFNREFLDRATGVYDNGSQTSQALALAYDLAPDEVRDKVIERLVDSIAATDGHPIAGVVGVRALIDALPKIGRSDLLYEMVTKRTMPSWGWWLEQGATTLWQNWDGSQSRNHIMFGSINDFLYENLAGIQVDPDHPGYRRFIIKPTFIEKLDHAGAWHESPFGRIRSSWERRNQGLRITVEAPPNTTALVYLPAGDRQVIEESGREASQAEGVQPMGEDNGLRVFQIGSGRYTFDIRSK